MSFRRYTQAGTGPRVPSSPGTSPLAPQAPCSDLVPRDWPPCALHEGLSHPPSFVSGDVPGVEPCGLCVSVSFPFTEE